MYHDNRGDSGYSPFQIVFGRDCFVAGARLPIERECVGASDFMDRIEWLDREVSKKPTSWSRRLAGQKVFGGYLPQTDLATGCGK